MTEHNHKQVELNIVEAIDHERPLVDELRRVLRLVTLANKALESSGVKLVTSTHLDRDADSSDLPAAGLELETVGLDEAAALVTHGRHDELERLKSRLLGSIEEFYKPASGVDEDKMISLLMRYIALRHMTIDNLAQRKHDE